MLRNVGKKLVVAALSILTIHGGQALAAAPGTGYWHTSGSKILDANNQQVRIAGINWYGFETGDAVVHGLTAQDYKTILGTIQANGYNTIRLPFSNQMVESPTVPTAIQYTNASGAVNSDLKGLNSLQIMDAIVAYAGQIGLRVILDNHRSEAGNSAEASGLWYTSAYPETAWISDWQTLVTRYQNNPTVIGVDLRNEPHNAANNGACWDCGTATNDWHLAAQRAGNAVLAINPKLLVFVEGTDEYNNDFYFWGGNLEGVKTSPVQLTVANQLVYSAHDYGPLESTQTWFNGSTTYDSLVATWTQYWAYISLNNIAPVWVGEFGTTNTDTDIQSTTPGSEGQWFSGQVQFLTANPSINWTYWALNGEDRYGLLDSTYDATPVSAAKQQALAGIQFPLSGGTPVTTLSFTLSQNPATVIAATSNTDTGGSGDTTEVTYTAVVNNRTSSDASAATITLTLPATAVMITEAATPATASCSASGAAYTCNYGTIAASASGGLTLTAIYPSAGLTFSDSGQSSQVVNATASATSQTLPAATVTTIVDKGNAGGSASIVATASPGNTYNYGQQGTVNFSISPAPSSAIPVSSFSAQLDGTQALTVTSTGANQYQIATGLLSGGSHSIVIQLAASSSYAATSTKVALTVSKATATVAIAGTSGSVTYGAGSSVVVNLAGLTGTGFAAPTGTVSLVVDSQAPLTASASAGTATFAFPAGSGAGSHTLSASYAGDSNYAAQTATGTLTVKPAILTATANPASRAVGAVNPTFQGTLTGVVTGDGITATYVSQADATTPIGTYSNPPNAIVPVLSDPNNKLGNYTPSLVAGALTITAAASGGNNSIIWATPNAVAYGTALSAAQLNATSTLKGTFTYKPAAGVVLPAGQQTLSVTFLPDGSTTTQTDTVTLAVNQATTSTNLTAVNATTAGSVTLNAVVTSQAGGATSGSVQFLDGSTSIASVTISSTGAATYNVLLSNGPHTLTAVYSGDANNLASTSTALLQSVSGGLDFQISSDPKLLSLAAGQSMPVTLSVFSADGFTGTVSFKCSGLPNGSTCAFAPATITGSASSVAQSTILTIGLPASGSVSQPGSVRAAGFFMIPGTVLGVILLWQRRKLQRKIGMALLAMIFLVNVSIGCGANNKFTGSTSPGGNSSSVGSYNALITATSPASVQTLTIPVTLVK